MNCHKRYAYSNWNYCDFVVVIYSSKLTHETRLKQDDVISPRSILPSSVLSMDKENVY